MTNNQQRKVEKTKKREKKNRRMLYHGKLYPMITTWNINCLFVIRFPC